MKGPCGHEPRTGTQHRSPPGSATASSEPQLRTVRKGLRVMSSQRTAETFCPYIGPGSIGHTIWGASRQREAGCPSVCAEGLSCQTLTHSLWVVVLCYGPLGPPTCRQLRTWWKESQPAWIPSSKTRKPSLRLLPGSSLSRQGSMRPREWQDPSRFPLPARTRRLPCQIALRNRTSRAFRGRGVLVNNSASLTEMQTP